jgi:hypothetical protein
MNTQIQSKEDTRTKFMAHFNLTESNLKELLKLFMCYGMSKGEADYRSPQNHSFLQGICQNFDVQYDTYSKGMTTKLKKILHDKYPQLTVENRSFRID